MTTKTKGTLALGIFLFVVLLAALFVNGCGKNQVVDGTVIEKTHEQAHTAYRWNGKHMAYYYVPEKFVLLVQTEPQSGSVEVKADVYVRVKVGDHVRVTVNDVWGIKEVQPE